MDPVDAPAESLDPNRLATLDRNLWRMLDANLNRCMEGLRTLEDVARFLLDDALASEQMKSLRHSLASVAARWPRQELLGGRDVSHDVV